jgi:hypothetical protein
MSVERVRAILSEIERMGARVELTASNREELAVLRAQLNFDPPEEYVAFCMELGGITIELVRTWFFYGAKDTLAKTREYAQELDAFRDEEGPYYPSRFFVFTDEGNYSNAASGWVWDADLGAFFRTDGGSWADRDDARDIGAWTLLTEELESIRDRIADPDDELVSGESAAVAARRRLPER